MSKNMFGLPENCKLLNLCGRYGFPDRCNTCGHDASKQQRPAEDFMEEHKRRMEDLFERTNKIIFGNKEES